MRQALAAFAALTLLAVAGFAIMGSTPNSTIPQGARYRWLFNQAAVDTPGVVIRFPKYIDGIPTASDSVRSVRWVHCTMLTLGGSNPSAWIIWSPQFPADVDTFWTHTNARAFTFGGCRIDSIKYAGIAAANDRPTITVLATD